MNEKQWLSQFADEMRRAGMPAEYIQRSVIELSDHAACEQDSLADSASVWKTPSNELANQFITNFRYGHWYRRMPNLLWLVLPFPITFLACVSYYAAGLVMLVQLDAGIQPTWGTVFFQLLLLGAGKILTPVIACSVMTRGLRRSARPKWVHHIAVGILAMLFLATTADLRPPCVYGGGNLTLSLSNEWIGDTREWGWQATQSIVVLMTAAAFTLLERRKHGVTPPHALTTRA